MRRKTGQIYFHPALPMRLELDSRCTEERAINATLPVDARLLEDRKEGAFRQIASVKGNRHPTFRNSIGGQIEVPPILWAASGSSSTC